MRKRLIQRLIFTNAFQDQEIVETICRLSRVEVIGLAGDDLLVSLVPDVEKGEVLVDSRGRGIFQRVRVC